MYATNYEGARPAYERLIFEGRIQRRHEQTLMRMHRVVEVCLEIQEAPRHLADWFNDLWDHIIRDGLSVQGSYLLLDLVNSRWSLHEPHEWQGHSDHELDALCARVAKLLANAPPPQSPELQERAAPAAVPPIRDPEGIGEITAFLRRRWEG